MKFIYLYFICIVFDYQDVEIGRIGRFLHSRKGVKNEQAVAAQRHM
jgi:hypothetical protein